MSPEKTRIVNVKCRYSEFLGFKIKVHSKDRKQVVNLTNYRSEDSWQQATEIGVKMDETYPYLTADEIEDIKAAYDYLSDSIRFKAHDQEYELYSASGGKSATC